ncbi:MAG: 23S rRNA (guanosine(2251)-2'-O)-methyltransferase RlmB [Gammaproteobacteria bacterium]
MSKPRIVAGIHSVRNVLRHGADAIRDAWVDGQRRDKRLRELLSELHRAGVRPQQVTRDELDRLAPGINHQGIVVTAAAPAALGEGDLPRILDRAGEPLLILILDGVQDPHNLGACLRTADAAGVDVVIAPKDRSVGLTPVACKVASGAAESVPFIQVTNLARTMKLLADDYRVWMVGTAGESDATLYDMDLSGNLAIVMGSEEKGMRRLTRDNCDALVRLPMSGSVESLNVSVATGVALYEAVRQRAAR